MATEKQIRRNRSRQYGDSTAGHRNLGLAWTGLLQNYYGIELPRPIPARIVLLMMAASKANRAAVPRAGQEDDYQDGRIYLELAEEAQRKEGGR